MAEPRLSINQFMVPGLSFDVLARWCRDAAVPGIGVLRDTVAELGPATTAAILRDHGISPTSICVALGLIHPDPERERSLFAAAVAALQHAAELAVPLVVVVGGPAPGLHLSDARNRAREQVWRLAAQAHRLGTQILVEPLHPAMVRLSALTTIAEAVELAVGTAATGVVLDTWHLWTDPRLTAVVTEHGATIPIVHFSDWPAAPVQPDDRDIPGEGIIDLAGLAGALLTAGFCGWWEIEVLSSRLDRRYPPLELLSRALAATRAMLAGPER